MATYEELIAQIEELRCTYNAFAVAIDGMACAGKRELAAHLAKKYGAPIIHMDDFRRPLAERPEGWEGRPGDEMDFERFNEEIAEPWMRKKELVYSKIDEQTGEITERLALPDAQIYLIEGTYALHPAVMDFYDLRLFCKGSPARIAENAAAQGVSPDAETLARHNTYFATYMTELLSDMVLDDTFTLPAGKPDGAAE